MTNQNNNKKWTLFILSTVAIAVWGFNGYKIIKGMTATQAPLPVEDFNNNSHAALFDSTVFLWQYPEGQRDPFQLPATPVKRAVVEKTVLPAKPMRTFPFQITGIIRNDSGDLVILKDSQEKVYFLPKDGKLDSLSIVAVQADSVTIQCNDRRYKLSLR